MPVIALLGNKGGAGKTTLAINLACGLNRRQPTVLLDADPQRSALQWREIAGEGAAYELVEVFDAVDQSAQIVARYRDQYEVVVIDCPPSIDAKQTRQALVSCDTALIPVLPSPLDLWATAHIEKKLDAGRDPNADLRVLLVINQLEPRTRLSKLVGSVVSEVGLPVANTVIKRRVAYRNAILQGRSILDEGAAAKDAAAEIQQLIDELVDGP